MTGTASFILAILALHSLIMLADWSMRVRAAQLLIYHGNQYPVPQAMSATCLRPNVESSFLMAFTSAM